jgi:hypothetical protein
MNGIADIKTILENKQSITIHDLGPSGPESAMSRAFACAGRLRKIRRNTPLPAQILHLGGRSAGLLILVFCCFSSLIFGQTKAVLTSPAAGTSLGTSNVVIKWSAGTGVTAYELMLGTNGAGTSGLYNSGSITVTSATVATLPANAVTVYARILSKIGGAWQYSDYTFKEAGTPAVLVTPKPGGPLGASKVTFTWSSGVGNTNYQLLLGTNGPGTSGLYNSGSITAKSATVPSISAYGVTVYARLLSESGGVWRHTDYTYKEAGTPAILASPAASTTFPGSTVTFKWNAGFGVTDYELLLGTNGAGTSGVYSSGPITGTSATVTTVPTSGGTIYVTLLSDIDGVWQHNYYTFTEASPPAAVSALSCSSSSITGAATDVCTVKLKAAAPASGETVSLKSSSTSVTVPASVEVPAKATSITFVSSVTSVTAAQTATLTASAASVSASFALKLNASIPTLSVSATTEAFGNVTLATSTTKSVTLTSSGTAPVTISAATLTGTGFSVSGATFPDTLNPGQAVTLSVKFDPTVVGAETGQLTIKSNSSTNATAAVSLSGTGISLTPGSVSCSSTSMTGSGTDACTVTLASAAPSGGTSISLSSSSTSVTVPATVTVAASATSAVFTATVTWVATAQTATLTATAGGVSKTVALKLNAASPTLSVSATTEAFGNVTLATSTTKSVTLTSSGTAPVTISAATLTGTGFSVSGAKFPDTLNPGQAVTLSVKFDPTVTGAQTGQLTITSNSSTNASAAVSLSGTGISLTSSSVSCSSNSMTGSGTDACTVTLASPAPSGGTSVSLSSSSTSVTVPATVTVAASATSAVFTATVTWVATAQTATLTATAGSISNTFALTLNAATPTLSINATAVTFGSVTINTPVTQTINLTSTGTAPVTISAVKLTGIGFVMSGASFPVTLNPGQAVALGVEFLPIALGVITGQLSITSNSSTNGSVVINLTGTGAVVSSNTVQLSWEAPSSSSEPIAGYNIYRSPAGDSAYELLNSSVDVQTTFVDTTVQSGMTYEYIVESVDSDGVASAPSNVATVTVP